jgi:chitodextrinase
MQAWHASLKCACAGVPAREKGCTAYYKPGNKTRVTGLSKETKLSYNK